MKRLISLAHLTVIELSPPEVVAAAAAAGYDSVDLRLAKAIPQDTLYPVFGDTPMRRELQQRMADTGVRVYDVELVRLRRETAIGDYLALMETGAVLGAQRMKVAADEPDEEAFTDKLTELAEAARSFGLTVDLEFMPFTEVRTLAQAIRVVQRVRAHHANCCVLIDSLHLSRSGGHPADLVGKDASLFQYVQWCDAPALIPPDLRAIAHEARTARMLPGEGGLPLAELLRQLPPDRPISLELPLREMAKTVGPYERAARAIAGARRVLAALDSGTSDVGAAVQIS